MRKLLRSIARANMKKEGIEKINKKRQDGKSFFSLNWKEWIFKKSFKKKKKID